MTHSIVLNFFHENIMIKLVLSQRHIMFIMRRFFFKLNSVDNTRSRIKTITFYERTIFSYT